MGWRLHWQRLKRSLGRRWTEWRLPRGYERLGTRYGGWWIQTRMIGPDPLLIDCGLGEDISFPTAFLARFGGRVIGIEPNPRSLAWVEAHRPAGMELWRSAFWHSAQTMRFHLPRPKAQLPCGADGVSGSLISSHEYVTGADSFEVGTVTLAQVLGAAGRAQCDVLKLDIEGAEYEVLERLCASGEVRRIGQLLVEFHHRVTHHRESDTRAAVRRIAACGFELVHVEARNHIFRRVDPR
ncbi:MAG: FkbM family methyltransferase [Betaproteobacteria bacterium]|nr:FkbM family methyltransferase [Betaproteobacteria bacterium]